VNVQPTTVPACEVCGRERTRIVDGRPLCDGDSCLSRTPGTRDQVPGTRNGSGEGGRALYVVGSPGVREESRREPELLGLIRDHERGLLKPAAVQLGELPAGASRAMRDVADDIRLLIGLRLAVDEPRPLPYSTRFCAERCGLYDHAHASRVLRELERAGVIERDGALTPRGKPDGTKLYRAPAP
jgi:hypothetical protein